jgi:4-diphosphocytidyl-2-C-methyl-D-erythritol kinase
MRSKQYLDDLVVWAPAKVNLFLEVLGKRPDGYHELETLMVTVSLYDTLVFRDDLAGVIRLQSSRAELSTGPDNLIVRAATLLRERAGCKRGCQVRLVKRIPMAAGLAGGSTDAAATLVALNRLWRLDLKHDELAVLAGTLGSDIPFFFSGPAAWCTGRGEKVASAETGTKLDLVLLCPAFGMPTAQVYRNLQVPNELAAGDAIRTALAQGDVEMIGRLLHNRLQPAAELLDPRIGEYQRRLAKLGPAGQLMSGSGSSLFALCRSGDEAKRIAMALRPDADREGFQVFQVRGCV